MSDKKLEIHAPAGEPWFTTRRVVDAPAHLVFRAWTTADLMRKWMGPRVLETLDCTVDLRVGGRWTMVQRAPDGTVFRFGGTYKEIAAPHRLVSTFEFEGMGSALDTLTLEEIDGKTVVTTHTLHGSVEARDGHVGSGMEHGMSDGYARLEELLAAA